eukprot:scaffold53031_cov55-Cyclotella_meneghiniana.AAC.2
MIEYDRTIKKGHKVTRRKKISLSLKISFNINRAAITTDHIHRIHHIHRNTPRFQPSSARLVLSRRRCADMTGGGVIRGSY